MRAACRRRWHFYQIEVLVMKTILVVLGGLVFAQLSDVPADADRSENETDQAAPQAPLVP